MKKKERNIFEIRKSMVEKTFYEEENGDGVNGSGSLERGTRFLGARAVAILNRWFIDNHNYPYPNEATTDWLAHQAGKLKFKEFIFILSRI